LLVGPPTLSPSSKGNNNNNPPRKNQITVVKGKRKRISHNPPRKSQPSVVKNSPPHTSSEQPNKKPQSNFIIEKFHPSDKNRQIKPPQVHSQRREDDLKLGTYHGSTSISKEVDSAAKINASF
jgi:hypothetical protein